MKARYIKRNRLRRAAQPKHGKGIYSMEIMFRLTRRNKVVPVRCEREMLRFDDRRRLVGLDVVGKVEVSTVFLMTKHGIFKGEADFFETAYISPAGAFDIVARYPTWKAAEEGHKVAVEQLKANA